MEKEKLTIGNARVDVEYEFLNESAQDITTEVAFPIAPNGVKQFFTAGWPRGVGSFHVWVENRELKYEIDAKAMLGGKDYADLLGRLKVDIASFGHFGATPDDIGRLPKSQQDELTRAGLYDGIPEWSAVITYHWKQTFPAHKVLHIRHEYEPAAGLEYLDVKRLKGVDPDLDAPLASVCLDPPLRNRLIAAAPNNQGFVEGIINASWVDYILTTANTWKTPIKQFELIIERPKPKGGEHWFVSLCWDGKVESQGPDTFVAKAANFIPTRELRVMFFQLSK